MLILNCEHVVVPALSLIWPVIKKAYLETPLQLNQNALESALVGPEGLYYLLELSSSTKVYCLTDSSTTYNSVYRNFLSRVALCPFIEKIVEVVLDNSSHDKKK